jgi:hypothetical protein
MGLIIKGVFVVLCIVVSVAVQTLLRILDWTLTPSGQARTVVSMPPLQTVNQELHSAFGLREAAGDPDEEVTTPYTNEDVDVRYFPSEEHMDFHTQIHGDEFV